jgi:hypothetical protein
MLHYPSKLKVHPAHRALLDVLEGQYLKPSALARRWQWSEQHLANLRKAGKGPAYVKLGRSVRYSMADAIAWEVTGHCEHVTRDRLALAVSALQGFSLDQIAEIQTQLESLLYGVEK